MNDDLMRMMESLLAQRNASAISLNQVVAGCVASKRDANLRPVYVKELDRYLNKFSKFLGDPKIHEVQIAHVERWLSEHKWSAGTRATGINRLSSLFGFAVRRGYIFQNPVDRLDRIRIERKPPEILTPAQTIQLLDLVKRNVPSMLPYMVIGVFGGVRPAELGKLTFDDIGEKFIRIDAATSKVRCRRIVKLEPNLQAWVASCCAGKTGPIMPKQTRRKLRLLRRKMGWEEWPKDILRHTAASYLMAKHQNAALVSDWLGNSPGILLTHYRELVSEEDTLAFWSIAP